MSATYTSALDIINGGLRALGAMQQISTTDKTNAAQEMQAAYRSVLDNLIRSYDWNCCMKEDTLALVEKQEGSDRPYVYAKPSDCLRIVSFNGIVTGYSGTERHERYDPPYKIRGQRIYSKYSPPSRVEYCYRNEDVASYDPCFCAVLSLDLAIECCERITQSTSKLEELQKRRRAALNNALRTNALEVPARPKATGNWLRSREVNYGGWI